MCVSDGQVVNNYEESITTAHCSHGHAQSPCLCTGHPPTCFTAVLTDLQNPIPNQDCGIQGHLLSCDSTSVANTWPMLCLEQAHAIHIPHAHHTVTAFKKASNTNTEPTAFLIPSKKKNYPTHGPMQLNNNKRLFGKTHTLPAQKPNLYKVGFHGPAQQTQRQCVPSSHYTPSSRVHSQVKWAWHVHSMSWSTSITNAPSPILKKNIMNLT